MKTREEIARFIEKQMAGKTPAFKTKKRAVHYGYAELHELMDFLFDGLPNCKQEEITKQESWKTPL